MYAPLPAKIWKQGGIPKVIQQSEQFKNPHGKVGNYNAPGATITANNAFFQSLGTNGRSCVTCHNPPSGLGLSLKNIKARFRSNLNDPLFAPVDGANCPDAVPPQYTSGSLYGGNRGKGKKALKDAYSMLLTRGLIRIGDQGAGQRRVHRQGPERQARLQLEPQLQQGSGDRRDDPVDVSPPDPVREPSLQGPERRPRRIGPDQRDVGRAREEPAHAGDRRDPGPCPGAEPADRGAGRPDRRLRDQVLHRPDPSTSRRAGWTPTAPSVARCIWRAGRPMPPTGFPPPPAFDEYNSWANLTGSPKADEQASIERGQAIFLNKPLTVANVGGFNDVIGLAGPGSNPVTVFPVTCQTCHGMPHAGSEVVFPPQRDIGVGGHATAASFNGPQAAQGSARVRRRRHDMPIFEFDCIGPPHPFYGTTIVTNDPGKGLITGKCADLGKTTVPQLRALAARAPFFHDGSAKDLSGVVDFYNQRFVINLTVQEKTDLVNFLSAL